MEPAKVLRNKSKTLAYTNVAARAPLKSHRARFKRPIARDLTSARRASRSLSAQTKISACIQMCIAPARARGGAARRGAGPPRRSAPPAAAECAKPRKSQSAPPRRRETHPPPRGRRGRGQLHLPEDRLSRGRRGFEAALPPPAHSWRARRAACRDAVSPSLAPPLLSIEYTLRGDEAYVTHHTFYNYDTLARRAPTRWVS